MIPLSNNSRVGSGNHCPVDDDVVTDLPYNVSLSLSGADKGTGSRLGCRTSLSNVAGGGSISSKSSGKPTSSAGDYGSVRPSGKPSEASSTSVKHTAAESVGPSSRISTKPGNSSENGVSRAIGRQASAASESSTGSSRTLVKQANSSSSKPSTAKPLSRAVSSSAVRSTYHFGKK